MPPTVLDIPYKPRGQLRDLWDAWEPELLVEGPAGTGKSRAVAERIVYLCEEFPGLRVFIIRQRFKDFAESTVTLLEDVVFEDHFRPVYHGGRRENRDRYTFPNGSSIVLMGMQNIGGTFSSEADILWFEEGWEIPKEASYELLHRTLRHKCVQLDGQNGRPKVWDETINDWQRWHQVIVTTNPHAPKHWLNRRASATDQAGKPRMRRILTRHSDNPSMGREELERLARLTGVRRLRLYLGIWAAAEGLVWENFDPAQHILPGPRENHAGSWRVGSIDWGYRKPGVHQVWGIDSDDRAVLIEEVYRVGWDREWLTVAKAMQDRWNVRVWLADPSRPEDIENYRRAGLYVLPADNERTTGFDSVRTRLASNRLAFAEDALVNADPTLQAEHQPIRTTDEIPEYVWKQAREGQPEKEDSDPLCVDHGCDAMRYMCRYLDSGRREFFRMAAIDSHQAVHARTPIYRGSVRGPYPYGNSLDSWLVRISNESGADAPLWEASRDGEWSVWCELRKYRGRFRPEQASDYIVAVGISQGVLPGQSVLVVGDIDTGRVVAEYARANITPEELARDAALAGHWFGGRNGCAGLIWMAGAGRNFADEMQLCGYQRLYIRRPSNRASAPIGDEWGWSHGKQETIDLFSVLRGQMDRGEVSTPSAACLAELDRIVWYKNAGVGPGHIDSERQEEVAAFGGRAFAFALFAHARSFAERLAPVEARPQPGSVGWDLEQERSEARRKAHDWQRY